VPLERRRFAGASSTCDVLLRGQLACARMDTRTVRILLV
jgi:hypothetical protein